MSFCKTKESFLSGFYLSGTGVDDLNRKSSYTRRKDTLLDFLSSGSDIFADLIQDQEFGYSNELQEYYIVHLLGLEYGLPNRTRPGASHVTTEQLPPDRRCPIAHSLENRMQPPGGYRLYPDTGGCMRSYDNFGDVDTGAIDAVPCDGCDVCNPCTSMALEHNRPPSLSTHSSHFQFHPVYAASETSEAPTLQRPPALWTSEPMLATVIAAAAAHQEDVPVEGTRVRRARTTAFFRGYWYTRAWVSSRKIAYRCSHYRQGCRGTMEFHMVSMGFAVVRPHTCRDHEVQAEAIDVYVAMAGVVDSLALADLSVTPRSIWDSVRAQFYPDDGDTVVRGLTEQQTLTRVYRIRNRAYGGEIYGVIERPPMSNVRNSNMAFFMFHHVVANTDPTQRPDRIIGWSHPVLFNLLRYHSVSLFIDGTFRCVPRFFAQCVVLMVHDRASGLFVPACFVLTTNRTADTYWDLIHYVIQATDQQLEPAAVVCDFEAGLLSAIETQFPNADIIGCLFHFKQAVRRKMKKLQIPECEITVAMAAGVLDMLTVIEPDEIEENGIRWVRKAIARKCADGGFPYSAKKWASFWVYFRRTWIERYNPAVWNVHGLDNHVVARTNNPLERFNREMNAAFPTPHPSMAVFVGTINDMVVRYAARLADIPRGRSRRIPRETIALPPAVVFEGDLTSSDEGSNDDRAVSEDADMASVLDSAAEDSDTPSVASMSFDYAGDGQDEDDDDDDGDDDEAEGEDYS